MRRNAIVTLTLFLAAGLSIDASPRADAIVIVRTYNYAGIPASLLSKARATADSIFKDAAISLDWIECRVPRSDGAPCTGTLDSGRALMLRLVDRPGEAADRPGVGRRVLALGNSLLDHEQRGGVLMTIDLVPIRTIAEQASTDLSTLLGRTIAHEIGHLLLGKSEHPREGLMRARWLQDELRGLKPAHWGFSRRESAQMRHGLAVRARSAN